MGWLLGAGMGFLFGGPLGAVVGGAFQHVFSKGMGSSAEMIKGDPKGEQIFITHLIAILTKVCMANGPIPDAERKTIHNFFSKSLHYHGKELQFIDAMMDETQRVNPDLHQVCKAFDEFAGKEQRLLLLDLVYQVVITDHKITKEEKNTIQQIINTLGIGQDEHEKIKSRYLLAKKNDHYSILGLSHSAADGEIKAAYRQLASQYHPDKVSHLGPELIAFSHEKFKSINEAYKAIKKERKI